MITRTKSLLTILLVLAFSMIFFVGNVLAQDDAGEDDAEGGYLPQIQAQMEERFGAGAWAEMIARMTERHGAEFTAEHLQWMDENGCPMLNGETEGGPMMRFGQWGSASGDETGQSYGPGSRMMGRGMMGHGRMNDVGGRGMMGRGRMNDAGGHGMMGHWMMESQGE